MNFGYDINVEFIEGYSNIKIIKILGILVLNQNKNRFRIKMELIRKYSQIFNEQLNYCYTLVLYQTQNIK